jgi:L,D-transpeptidase YbiS
MRKPYKPKISGMPRKFLQSAGSKLSAFFQHLWKGTIITWQYLRSHLAEIVVIILVIMIPAGIRAIILEADFLDSRSEKTSAEQLALAREKITAEIIYLDKKLSAKTPKSYYLVINSSSNEFYLYKGDKLIRKDKCSTGSYILLKNGEQQQWMFRTPVGEFRVQSKTTSPVWKKPDWAFVEEGLPVPPPNHASRFEYGVLGDYALSLGQGYLIHGTLYQRFLGLPVTHGCIRLNDENLELVYRSLPVGAKVFIY